MLAYLPSIIAAAVALTGMFSEPLQGLVAAHPGWAAGIAGVSTILAHLSKSPSQK